MRPLRVLVPTAWALAALLRAAPAAADRPPPEPAPAPAPVPAPVPAPAPAPYGSGQLFDPKFREGRPSDPLAPGERPLLRGTLDAFVDLVEGGLDVALTADEEQSLRDGIETAWPKASDETRTWFDTQARRRSEIRALYASSASDVVLAQKIGESTSEIEARVKADPKGAWQTVVAAARARRDAVASPGAPAISVADVEAFESLTALLVAIARNEGTTPTPGQALQERKALLESMGDSGALVRGRYDKMGRLWLLVKAKWDAADEVGRLKLRGAVLRWFRPLAGLSQLEPGLALDLATYATLAAEVRDKLPVFEAYHGALATPGKVVEVAMDGLGLDPKAPDTYFETASLSLR